MKNSDSRQAYTFHVTSLKHHRPKYIHPRIVYDDRPLYISCNSHHTLTLTFYSHAYYWDVQTAVIFLSVSIVAPNIFHPRIVYDDHALVQQPSHFDLDFYSHAYYRDVHTAVIFLSVSSSPQISSTLKSYMMTMPCTFLATSLSPQIYSTLKSYMMTAPLWSALLLLSLCLLISLS